MFNTHPMVSTRILPMNPLERHLEAARGWLLLSAAEEAVRELDGIGEVHRLDPQVLVVRVGVFQAPGDWRRLETVVHLLCDTRPHDPQ